jgi:zinc protease
MKTVIKMLGILTMFATITQIPDISVKAEKTAEQKAKLDKSEQDWLEEASLENGLKVIVVHTKTKNVVTGGVGYFVGSGDDPRNVVGISHVLEHMMFKGTKNLDGAKLKEIIFTYNKGSNAFTSYDITFYMHTCNKQFLELDLKIEADRMQNLKLDGDDLAKEKEVVIEERKMRTESDPRRNYMEESAWKAMYLFSNYSYPLIGYVDQIKACSREEVQKHYNTYYVPNNAFLLLIGDIELTEAVALAKKIFGAIPRGKKIKRNRIIDPLDISIRYTMDHDSDQITVHNLNLAYKIDRAFIDTLRKLVTIELAAGILAIGESSLLYQNIVDKKEMAYTVGSYLDIRACDKGRLSISTVFRENQRSADVGKEMCRIIHNFSKEYITKDMLEEEKRKTLDKIEMYKNNSQLMLSYIIEYIANGYKSDEIKNISNIIKSISFQEVKDVASKIFTEKNNIMRIYSHPAKVKN